MGAMKLLRYGTPACVVEHACVVPLAQLSNDSPARCWRRQHCPHVVVEGGFDLNVFCGDRARLRGSSLLRR